MFSVAFFIGIFPGENESCFFKHLNAVAIFSCFFQQAIPGIKTVSQLKFFDSGFRKAAFAEIAESYSLPVFMVKQKIGEIIFCVIEYDVKTVAFVLLLDVFVAASFLFLDFNAVFFGKILHRFNVGEAFQFLYKGDGIAGFGATETFKNSLGRIYRKGWTFFIVKRAACPVVLAFLFQRHEFSYHIDDVDLLVDPVYGFVGKTHLRNLNFLGL